MATIPLQVTVPQVEDPLSQYMRLQTAQTQQQQMQAQRQALQIQQQELAKKKQEESVINSTYAASGGSLKEFFSAIQGKISPQTLAGLQKQFADAQKALTSQEKDDFEFNKAKTNRLAQLLQGVTDDASWHHGITQAWEEGAITAEDARQYSEQGYNKNVVDQFKYSLVSGKELFDLVEAERKSAEEKELFPFKKQTAEAEAVIKRREAGLEGGLSPEEYSNLMDEIAPTTSKIEGVRSLNKRTKDTINFYLDKGNIKEANEQLDKARDEMASFERSAMQASATRENKSFVDPEASAAMDDVAKALTSKDPKELVRLRDLIPARGSDARLRVFHRAKVLDPSFSTSEVERKLKMMDDAYNGKMSLRLQSFNTFLEHAGSAYTAAKRFEATNVKLFNKPINWLRENVKGDPKLIDLMGALEPVRKEFEGFLLGGRALYSEDRLSAEKLLSEDSSPRVILASLKRLVHTAAARANEENYRFKKTVGADIEDLYSPEAAEALGTIEGKGSSKVIEIGDTNPFTTGGR